MQQSMIEIGKILNNPKRELVEKIPQIKFKNENKHILKFLFDTNEKKVDLDLKEEMDNETVYKYFFVGGAASRAPQWYTTTKNSKYHLTETIVSLLDHPFDEKTRKESEDVLEIFYIDRGEKYGFKDRYIFDLDKIGVGFDYKKEYKSKKDIKEENAEVEKKFYEYIKNKYSVVKNAIGLFVIIINNENISDNNLYKKEVRKVKLSGDIDIISTKNEECSICGNKKDLANTFKDTLSMKLYTTNLVIFQSSFNGFIKNMLLCKKCLDSLIIGERYILNNLKTKVFGMDLILVPHILYGEKIGREDIDYLSKKLVSSFNFIKQWEGLEEFRKEMYDIAKYDFGNNINFTINFLFFQKNQKATKMQLMIKDVNPSVFKEFNESRTKVINTIEGIFGDIINDKYYNGVSLKTFYFLVPAKMSSGDNVEFRDILSVYQSILKKHQIKKRKLIKNFLKTFRLIKNENSQYNVVPKKVNGFTLINRIFDSNQVLLFLKYYGILKGGEKMNVESLNLQESTKNYIEQMSFDECQTGLFLLGVLVGSIASKQYNSSSKKKPILNKLNFSGMDKNKIIRLSNDVLNRMKQLNILYLNNEKIFSESKRLLDKNINNWSINNADAVYFILSGYAFHTKSFSKGEKYE